MNVQFCACGIEIDKPEMAIDNDYWFSCESCGGLSIFSHSELFEEEV